MSAHDYRINAEVRRYLVSRWVDVTHLQIGTTNGVVYIMGHLETTVVDPGRRADAVTHDAGERSLRVAQLLDKELRRLQGVRDLVFKLDNVQKKGRVWCATSAAEKRLENRRERTPRTYEIPAAPGGFGVEGE